MKKGFTLIELLAVIVILAIIALIATPIILGIINDAKEESKDRSVEIIIDSAQIFATDKELKGGLELDKNIYDEIVNKINGDRPDEGQVYINKHGEVALSLRYGDYCYTKSYGEKKYYKEKTDEECITPFYYLKRSVDTGGDIPFLEGPITRYEIEKITTLTTNKVPDDIPEENVWDVTADSKGNVNEDIKGKVMAWYKDEDNNGLYEVYIGQEGGVKANPSSGYVFEYLQNLTEIDLSKFDTSNVTSMYQMFHHTLKLANLDLSKFDTSNVTNMGAMFYGCNSLTKLDLSSFNTSNVTNMSLMFSGCENLISLDVSRFDTSEVKNMTQMFNGCSKLTNLNVSGFNTGKVTEMTFMFSGCENLTNLDLSKFDTSNVMSMYGMFGGCKNLTSLNLSKFDTSNVTNMRRMIAGCNNLTKLDLSNFDTSKVTNMHQMFEGDSNLKQILVGKGWTTANANTDEMFSGCGTNQVTVK